MTTHDPMPQPRQRWRLLILVTAAFAIAGLGVLGVWLFHGRFYESTEDAYVAGHLVQVMPQVPGTVVSIHADDTDYVEAGQLLVELDATDARLQLQRAEASLAQAVRDVRVLFANDEQLAAEVDLRAAEYARVASDVERRRGLVDEGAVSQEELAHLQESLSGARAALEAAKKALAANQARIEGTDVQHHPNVERAAAQVREAYLALERTSIHAPTSGHVARRVVQVGQRVAVGAPLMALVTLDQLWVDANFKEVQLRDMRIGQQARVVADIYGDDVVFEGRVVGVGVGTGAAFSLLPPQNASGNWIKIVQRVPVRIELKPEALREHPLRIGLSTHVRVDLRGEGERLAVAPREEVVTESVAARTDVSRANARVEAIIAANLGRPLAGMSAGRD